MVIISSTTDDEQLWARFAVCQDRETGFKDKNQSVLIKVKMPGIFCVFFQPETINKVVSQINPPNC